jgi:hypothetical protein
MGYSLHIERPDNPISKEEWEVWVNDAPDFKLSREWRATNPRTGAVIAFPCDALGEWINPVDGCTVVFDYSRGRISVRADANAMDKAKQIAEALGARLIGDEGETYYPPTKE